ncbi:hypothetical protein KDA_14720 [Dictyobacter alpinus]|uniref:Enoyl-CoA hydratase n=1 Tax=Dictyobacter alpinus TaxID=2014873 RepID=A0A402B3R7_9CHLR|nr:enoyl-CoA hydratase/isomerase family protein [Dictyobacter alpinus]GCE25988.1 hypothetical protein KDA_14720 [Dictyobacter alpinus]
MSDIHVRQRNGIFWLILDRHPRNMLTATMLEQLAEALLKASNKSPRLIVLTGMGEDAFCGGVDLPADSTEAQRQEILLAAQKIDESFSMLYRQGIPTVALIKGLALNAGCELALLCDTLLAREDAEFQLPETSSSIFPRTQTILASVIGQQEMEHLVQSSENVDARAALRLGLVHQVLASRRFLQDAEELLTMLMSAA